MINASLSEDKKRTKGGKSRAGSKRWNENEKAGQESGVEKVNNGRTEEIAMEDWLRNVAHGGTLIYIEIKKKKLPPME